MMNNFRFIQNSIYMIFHNKSLFRIIALFCAFGMSGHVNMLIPISHNKLFPSPFPGAFHGAIYSRNIYSAWDKIPKTYKAKFYFLTVGYFFSIFISAFMGTTFFIYRKVCPKFNTTVGAIFNKFFIHNYILVKGI